MQTRGAQAEQKHAKKAIEKYIETHGTMMSKGRTPLIGGSARGHLLGSEAHYS